MESAPSVMGPIEQKITPTVTGSSLPVVMPKIDTVRARVQEASQGPRRLEPLNASSHDPTRSLPSYRRGLGWRDSDGQYILPAALSTLHAPPLPSPPVHLTTNESVVIALQQYHAEIKVETPFDVACLERFLGGHPNRAFVDSVLHGLREGFWPLSETEWKDELQCPEGNYPMEESDLEALRAFRDKEIAAGQWSDGFQSLLPGMHLSPIFVVWQKNKPRIVTDYSASHLNNDIPQEQARFRYDNMGDFGQALHNRRQSDPAATLTLYKSDIASTFLNLPAHPIWQLHQVVTVDGQFHIVCRLVFGNRASPYIWCAVSALICWIAIFVLHIPDIFVYIDDFFSIGELNDLVHFHGKLCPHPEVLLLLFWERIRCPFDDPKQLDGPELKVIGF